MIECRIDVSVNQVIVGSDNDISPLQRQAIILANNGSPLIVPFGKNVSISPTVWKYYAPTLLVPRGVYSVRFRIGMLSTARRLETLQG